MIKAVRNRPLTLTGMGVTLFDMTVQTEQLLRPTDSLASRLWLLRLELGRREGRRGPVSQKETALRCGVGYGAWQSWEEGRAPRDAIRQLSKVADALALRAAVDAI